MYLLYCDETNFEKKSGDFFVYGGVVIPPGSANKLSTEIDALRGQLDVPQGYVFKFNPGPEKLSHEQFIALKRGLIEIAARNGVHLLVNLLLHDIAKSSVEARRNCINTLCYHFHCYLKRLDSHGIVLIDRFTDKQIDAHLQGTLAVGLHMIYSGGTKLDRILGYHYAAIGQSHFCSLIDVLLGSLRFSMNAFTQNNEAHRENAQIILQQLAPLFFVESGVVSTISLWFSPMIIKVEKYRVQYLALIDHLKAQGINVGQTL